MRARLQECYTEYTQELSHISLDIAVVAEVICFETELAAKHFSYVIAFLERLTQKSCASVPSQIW